MNIVLFRPFPDPYRFSMHWYADAIERRVRPWLGPGEAIGGVGLRNPRLDGWGRYWDQYVRYQRFARTVAGDVNHVTDHVYGHLARALPAGRTIVTFHDAVSLRVPGVPWRTRAALRYNFRALQSAAAVICVSETARRDLLDLVAIPLGRLHVIPHGVDERFRPSADRALTRRRLGFNRDTVLVVGHTQHYMNVERMLRAFGTLVRQHGAEAQLVKIGQPFTPEQMRLIAEFELGDRVQNVGRVEDEDLPAYYQAADVLLYAPLFAGFGLPPLEAMACGTPVVASNRGAIPEITGQAAVLVDADDEGAMAAALAEILTSSLRRRRLIDGGYEHAARFEWTAASRQLIELYRAVARA